MTKSFKLLLLSSLLVSVPFLVKATDDPTENSKQSTRKVTIQRPSEDSTESTKKPSRTSQYQPGDPSIFTGPDAIEDTKGTISLGYRILRFVGLA